MNLEKRWLGTKDYLETLRLQEFSAERVRARETAVVLGVEHPAVITLGRRGQAAQDVFSKTLPVVTIERGGQAVLHNHGQLVIYPILNLREFNLTPKKYIALLSTTTALLLESQGVPLMPPALDQEPGLYTSRGKIAFFGVRISRGVTTHGVAINVLNSLAEFSAIRACGVAGSPMSRVADWWAVPIDLESLFSAWFQMFAAQLEAVSACPAAVNI